MKDSNVVDTNVLLSFLLFPDSIPAQAFKKAQKIGDILLSEDTFDELKSVLYKDTFDKYLPLYNRLEFLASLKKKSQFIKVTSKIDICRDSEDNKFVELAVDGKANHIITGDKDLLTLKAYQGVTILKPVDFL